MAKPSGSKELASIEDKIRRVKSMDSGGVVALLKQEGSFPCELSLLGAWLPSGCGSRMPSKKRRLTAPRSRRGNAPRVRSTRAVSPIRQELKAEIKKKTSQAVVIVKRTLCHIASLLGR